MTPSATPKSAVLGDDPAALYQAASNLFKKERFKEALDLFEKLGRIDACSAPVHFMLGMTYTRLGGQLCSDDDSLVPWLRKSVAAFRRASELANDHGGLTAEQRNTATEFALHGERVIERHSPSIPEERRRGIFADLMETTDTEFLSDTTVDRGMEEASRKISFKMMQEAISRGGARAEAAALDKVAARHSITRGQLLAIKEEGRENKWPFKAVQPRKPVATTQPEMRIAEPANASSLSEIPKEVGGNDAGTLVKKIVTIAKREGWNPIPSVKLHCVKCNAPVSLTHGLASPFTFIHSDGKYGQCQPLDDPLTCEKCASALFRVTVHPTQFKDWLHDSLDRVKPSDQDPAVGFRDDETGEIFRDRKLVRASSFEDMWMAICRYVDPQGDFNPDYSFNMIGTRYLDRHVPGLAHHNKKADTLIIIVKDESGGYWYACER